MKVSFFLATVPLVSLTFAGPTRPIENRELDLVGNIKAITQGIEAAVSQGDPTGIVKALQNVVAVADKPTTPEQALASLQSIVNGTSPAPSNLYAYIANLEALNLIDTIDSLLGFVQGVANGQDSPNNHNPPPPDCIYPKKLSCDVPYSVDEETLRAAIYIPPGFTYGRIPPVVLFPGTGNYGYETFKGNLIPLLTGSDFADPVWVNVPGRLLNDAQKTAEFTAYAINYMASITKTNITLLAWSQGNIDAQWAYKYWPSTTTVVSDHVGISADYKGTIVANFAALPGEPLPPSLLQQEYLDSSNFITALRTFDGDSAYVPTTIIYSGFFDEIVEPQQGVAASSYLNDVRGVGVTNYQVQQVCPGQPAGSFYTHEGVMYNPLPYYLLRDAMANKHGPGNVKNLDLSTVCATYLAPGLDIGDLLVTENALAIAGLAILTYPKPVFNEPAISPYASSSPVSTCLSTTTSTTLATPISTSTSSYVTSSHTSKYGSSTWGVWTSTTTTTSESGVETTTIGWESWSATTSSTSTKASVTVTSSTTKPEEATPTSSEDFSATSLQWETWTAITSTSGSDKPSATSSATSIEIHSTWGEWSGSEIISGSSTTVVATPSSAAATQWVSWSGSKSSVSAISPSFVESATTQTWSEWESVSASQSGPAATTVEWTSATATYVFSSTAPAYGDANDNSAWNVWSSTPTASDASIPVLTVSVSPIASVASTGSEWATWANGTGVAITSGAASSKATGASYNGTATRTGHVAQWTGAASQNTVQRGMIVALTAGVAGLLAI